MVNKINLIEIIYNKLKNCNNDKSISELHCQKIIFFVVGLFYKKFRKNLLNDLDFRAWKYGVVEINYHNFFRTNNPIYWEVFNCYLNNEEEEYINKIVEIFSNQSPWALVELSHISYAWYANCETENKIINIKDIYNSFDNFLIN